MKDDEQEYLLPAARVPPFPWVPVIFLLLVNVFQRCALPHGGTSRLPELLGVPRAGHRSGGGD